MSSSTAIAAAVAAATAVAETATITGMHLEDKNSYLFPPKTTMYE